MSFQLQLKSKKSKARLGTIKTAHGSILTPFFMPIATRAAVKGLTSEDLKNLGSQIILSNTYHLWQRPGLPVIKKAGGLHQFMDWPGAILTDSGGYQVFSLSKMRKITERGVSFVSEIDGRKHLLTPELAVEIQRVLGSDMMMSLDECPPYPSSKKYIKESLELTARWAERGLRYFKRKKIASQMIFGIVQGGVDRALRRLSARQLVRLNFDGYAIGGLAVGEPAETMYRVLNFTIPCLPEKKPRYLMGVGKPEQIVAAVRRGVDMFDCVIPTRNARHGTLYVWKNSTGTFARMLERQFYQEIRIKQAKYSGDTKPLDRHCDCYLCQHHSRAYLRHLFMSGDPLARRLATLHNVRFYLRLMREIREAIKNGKL